MMVIVGDINMAFSVQICVGGPTLAHGYLNRPELNAARFIKPPPGVPKAAGNRLYCTGDWGYMLSTGNLEICGRCDSMVKVRGYSIEIQVNQNEMPAVCWQFVPYMVRGMENWVQGIFNFWSNYINLRRGFAKSRSATQHVVHSLTACNLLQTDAKW